MSANKTPLSRLYAAETREMAEDVAAVLKGIASRSVGLRPALEWPYSGSVKFNTLGGWVLTFFVDSNEVDYLNRAEGPDGRVLTFEDATACGCEPCRYLLTETELDHLEDRLMEVCG